MVKLEQKSIKELKKLCWKLCSEFIRRRDKGICFTCFKRDDWKNQDAGHFIHGHTKATFFEEANIHCQCFRCNRMLHGNQRVYTLRMIDLYGRDFIDKLEQTASQEHTYSRKEVIIWIAYYKQKLKESE